MPQIQKNDFSKDSPIILTSCRLVDYEGCGDETRSNPWLAELRQDKFVGINTRNTNNWVSATGRRSGLKALRAARSSLWPWSPNGSVRASPSRRCTLAVTWRAGICGTSNPKAQTPMCWVHPRTPHGTHGYDPVIHIQKTLFANSGQHKAHCPMASGSSNANARSAADCHRAARQGWSDTLSVFCAYGGHNSRLYLFRQA